MQLFVGREGWPRNAAPAALQVLDYNGAQTGDFKIAIASRRRTSTMATISGYRLLSALIGQASQLQRQVVQAEWTTSTESPCRGNMLFQESHTPVCVWMRSQTRLILI